MVVAELAGFRSVVSTAARGLWRPLQSRLSKNASSPARRKASARIDVSLASRRRLNESHTRTRRTQALWGDEKRLEFTCPAPASTCPNNPKQHGHRRAWCPRQRARRPQPHSSTMASSSSSRRLKLLAKLFQSRFSAFMLAHRSARRTPGWSTGPGCPKRLGEWPGQAVWLEKTGQWHPPRCDQGPWDSCLGVPGSQVHISGTAGVRMRPISWRRSRTVPASPVAYTNKRSK